MKAVPHLDLQSVLPNISQKILILFELYFCPKLNPQHFLPHSLWPTAPGYKVSTYTHIKTEKRVHLKTDLRQMKFHHARRVVRREKCMYRKCLWIADMGQVDGLLDTDLLQLQFLEIAQTSSQIFRDTKQLQTEFLTQGCTYVRTIVKNINNNLK